MQRLSIVLITLSLIACSARGTSSVSSTYPDAYEAVSLFGLGTSSVTSLPKPEPGEVVINYGGWSLNQLRETKDGKRLLDDSTKGEAWANATFPPGIYRLSAEAQKKSIAPVVILATAILSYELQIEQGRHSEDQDPLKRMVDQRHCKNQKAQDLIGLYWGDDWGKDGKSHSTKLFIDKEYCHVLGGGIWEAKM